MSDVGLTCTLVYTLIAAISLGAFVEMLARSRAELGQTPDDDDTGLVVLGAVIWPLAWAGYFGHRIAKKVGES